MRKAAVVRFLNECGLPVFAGTVQQVLNLSDSLTTYNIGGMEGFARLDIAFDGVT